MALTRIGTVEMANVAALVALTGVTNKKADTVRFLDTGKEAYWVPGATSGDINQTSESANGRWMFKTGTNKSLTGTGAFAALPNNVMDVIQVAITGLPVGTAISAAVTNGNTAFGGAAIPSTFDLQIDNLVKVANQVECVLQNNSGVDSAVITTINLSVTLV